MSFVIQKDGTAVTLEPGVPIFTNGVQFSWNTMLSWSNEERTAYGISEVTDPPSVPESISRLQGQLALNAAGLLVQVNSAVAAADASTQIWYADALNWRRNDPVLLAMATAVGLSPAQVDELFIQAKGISQD